MTSKTATEAKAPNEWAVLLDYSKVVVTLASALLGLTVTFLRDFAPLEASGAERVWLILSWGFLLICIISGVLAAALSINVLRHGGRRNGAILAANVAFFALVLAGAAFVALGVSELHQGKSENTIHAITLARDAAREIDSTETWRLKLMKATGTGQVLVILEAVSKAEEYSVEVDLSKGVVLAISRNP